MVVMGGTVTPTVVDVVAVILPEAARVSPTLVWNWAMTADALYVPLTLTVTEAVIVVCTSSVTDTVIGF
jgi:hypothetical protein